MVAFYAIHALLAPTRRIKVTSDDNKKYRKPSIQDSVKSTIAFVESEFEVQKKIEDTHKITKSHNIASSPFIIIVGNYKVITAIFLSIDTYLFKFSKVIEAVDILFKVHYVFNVKFASESELFYEFLARYFFKMDKIKISQKVTKLICDLR